MKLGYPNSQGRAEVIRLLLAYFRFPYTEINPKSREEIPVVLGKYHFDFPNFPFLADGEVHLTESLAIPVYLAHKANRPEFFGKLGLDHVKHTIVQGVLVDIQDVQGKVIASEDPQKAFEEVKERLDGKFAQLAGFLGSKDYLFGYLTFGDFFLAYQVSIHNKLTAAMKTDSLVCKHANITALTGRIGNLPGVKEYLATETAKKRPVAPVVPKLKFE